MSNGGTLESVSFLTSTLKQNSSKFIDNETICITSKIHPPKW